MPLKLDLQGFFHIIVQKVEHEFDAKGKTNLVFDGVLECVVGEAGGGLNVGRHDGDEILEVHQICNETRGRKA